MANVLIRDIPDQVVNELKQRARMHKRPLQQELKEILVTTARHSYVDVAKRAAAIRKKLIKKGKRFTDSVEILREDRSR